MIVFILLEMLNGNVTAPMPKSNALRLKTPRQTLGRRRHLMSKPARSGICEFSVRYVWKERERV